MAAAWPRQQGGTFQLLQTARLLDRDRTLPMLSIVTHAEGRRASLERLLSITARMRPRPFEVVVVHLRGLPAGEGDWSAAPRRPASTTSALDLHRPAPQSVPPERFRPAAFAVRRGVLDHVARAGDRAVLPGDDLGHAAAGVGVPIWLWPTAVVHRQSSTRKRART